MTENEYDENLLFYSCEATGDGQKPVLTITYGYLQSRVLDYAESDKGFFITDTYQPQFAGDYQSIRILVTQNNSSIPALHEYGTQPDARGFFHLISGETGFKIFGTYDLNYLYIAENEGTKAPRFGATQDEWVIVGMRNYDYLILSAEDPTLSLTRTDTGVALQSLEKDNEDQVWRFYENITTQSADVRYIQSGIYYINNNQTKTFLTQKQDYLLGIQLEAGTEAALGNRMAWYIGYAGDGQYMIQSLENPDYILTAGASSPMLVPQEVFDDTETFQITPSPNGGYSIKCTYTMYEDSDETETVYMGVSSSGSLVHCTATDDSTSWRLCKQEDYEELSHFSISLNTSHDVLAGSVSSYSVDIDEMLTVEITGFPSNADWTSSNDFEYISNNPDKIQIIGNQVKGIMRGSGSISVRHKVTNITQDFPCSVEVSSSFDATIAKFHDLYNVALTYCDDNTQDALMLALQYIRRNNYNNEQWATVAGAINTNFTNYVDQYYPSIRRYFSNFEGDSRLYVNDPNELGTIDFPHFCATINGLIYDSDGFKATLVGEANINNLCGWAGDLQTLCLEILEETDYSNNYNTIYNTAYQFIGSPLHSFSISDLLADTDAFNIYNLLNNSTSNFFEALNGYYTNGCDLRFTSFTNNWSKQEIYNCVRSYTTDTFFLWFDWPILEEVNISTTQSDAIANAFTDYIWEEIQNEHTN